MSPKTGWPFDLSPAEAEIVNSDPFHKVTIDPFGIFDKIKVWQEAKEIDSLFTRKTVSKGRSAGEMFHCQDCDSFVRCTNHSHDSYLRCFGSGAEHCLRCNT